MRIEQAQAEQPPVVAPPTPPPPSAGRPSVPRGWTGINPSGGVGSNQGYTPPKVTPAELPKPGEKYIPTDEFGGSPFQTELDRLRVLYRPEQTYENVAKRNLGYVPTYWQDPKAVARYYNMIQAQPAGTPLPEWLDPDVVNTAYRYFEMRNGNNKDPMAWKYLNADDPVLQYLAQVPPPPREALLPHEGAFNVPMPMAGDHAQLDPTSPDFDWTQLTVEQKRNVLSNPQFSITQVTAPGQAGLVLSDPEFDLWGKSFRGELPWWQPMAYTLLSNPKTTPIVQGAALTVMTKGKGWPLALAMTVLGYGAQSENEQVRGASEFLLEPFIWGAEKVEQAAGLSQYLSGASGDLAGTPIGNAWEEKNPLWLMPIYSIGRTFADLDLQIAQDHIAKFTENPAEVWDAMKVFYETQAGEEVWVIGEAEKVPVQPGYTLADAAKRAIEGESPDVILADYQRVYGVNGVASDFLLSSIYDPLNVLPGATAEVRARISEGNAQSLLDLGVLTPEQQARVKIESIKAEVFRASEDMTGTMIPWSETSRLMRSQLQTLLKVEEAKFLSPWEQRIAGLTPDGRIRELLPTSQPESFIPKVVQYLTTLTPESKAILSAHMLKENMSILFGFSRSPAEKLKLIEAVASGDMQVLANMGAETLNNPEVYTALGAVRDFVPQMQELVANYQLAEVNRDLFWQVQAILGEEPGAILKNFTDGDPRPDFERLKASLAAAQTPEATGLLEQIAAGEITAESLADMFKVFKDNKVAIHEAEFNARVLDKFFEHMGKWGVEYFGVKQASQVEEVMRMMKGAQSLLLLDLSPAYLVNNFINNRVLMAAGGVYGFTPERKMLAWMDEFGVVPSRLKEGFGPTGDMSQGTKGAETVIAAARKGDGIATKAADAVAGVRRTIGLASRASSAIEAQSSMQMYYATMKEFYGRHWVAGRGFNKMPAALEARLRDNGIDPEVWYRNIEGAMSKADFEKLRTGATTRSVQNYINGAAERLGVPAENITAMLSRIGVLDELRDKINRATTDRQIQRAFDDAERKAMDRLDIQTAQEIRARAEHIANKVKLEGPAGAIEIFQDLILDNFERKIDNDRIWDAAYDRIEKASDTGLINAELERAARETDAAWRRTQAHEAAAVKGVIDGLGLGNDFGREFLATVVRQHDILRKFFSEKNRTYKKFFRTIFPDAESRRRARVEIDRDLNQKFTAAEREVLNLQAKADDLFSAEFGRQFGGELTDVAGQMVPSAEAMARTWRESIQTLSGQMHETITAFRESLIGLSYDQKRAAWQAFKPDYQAQWRERAKANLDGIAQLYKWGENAETVVNQTEKAAAAVARNAERIEQVSTNIDQIGTEYGVPTADEAGNPIPGARLHIIKIVKKYGGNEGAHIRDYADITPDLARKAFDNRKAQKEAQMSLPFTDEQRAAAAIESEALPEPHPAADISSEVAADVAAVPLDEQLARTVQGTRMSDMQPAMRDALQYELSVMKGLVEAGEPGRRNFEGGQFTGATSSSYPDWYGPLRGKKEDVLFALEALTRGLDKDQALYRNLKLIAAGLLRDDPALLQNYGWAKVFGMEGDVAHNWERRVRTIENDLAGWDPQESFNIPFIEQALDDAYESLSSLPEEMQDIVVPFGDGQETYLDLATRVFDDAQRRLEAAKDYAEVGRAYEQAEVDMAEQQLHADNLMTRDAFRDQLIERMGLDEDQADAVVAITDARAEAWGRVTGRAPEAWYQTRLKHIVRGGEGGLYQAQNPVWYSRLAQAVEEIPMSKMTVEQLRGLVKKAGVKADELKWTGFDEFLEGKDSITKEQMLEHLRDHQVRLDEVVHEDAQEMTVQQQMIFRQEAERVDQLSAERNAARDAFYQTTKTSRFSYDPYRLKEKEAAEIGVLDEWQRWREARDAHEDALRRFRALERKYTEGNVKFGEHTLPGGENYREILLRYPGDDLQSPHWNERDVLAHIRTTDRVDADGKRMLFLEELQSDWHQAGRKGGYANPDAARKIQALDAERAEIENSVPSGYDASPELVDRWTSIKEEIDRLTRAMSGVPEAPFAKTWHELTMKRALRMAAEEGYERVGWTTGAQQADRYDLRKQVDSLEWYEGSGQIYGNKDGRQVLGQFGVKRDNLADYIGKEAAEKMLAQEAGENGARVIEGDDLAVGGSGMSAFYDNILPSYVDKYAKKWGAKSGEVNIQTDEVADRFAVTSGGTVWHTADTRESAQAWIDANAKNYVGNFIVEEGKTGAPVHYVDVTPAMRESVMRGQPMFQGEKGSVSFEEDGRAIIHALESPDISTAVHELGHIFRRDLEGSDLATIEEWAGVRDGAWDTAAEEKFARGFEKYLADGKAPTSKLAAVFEKFKSWMIGIYQSITGSAIDIEIPAAVRAVFDRLMGDDRRKQLDLRAALDDLGYNPDDWWVDLDGRILPKEQFKTEINNTDRAAIVDAIVGKGADPEFKAKLERIKAARAARSMDPNVVPEGVKLEGEGGEETWPAWTRKGEDVAGPEVISEADYLARNGAPFMGGSDVALHKNRPKSDRAHRAAVQREQEAMSANNVRREELSAEYWQMVDEGKIRPPTSQESLERTASGHPDNPSVQAARRVLAKREARKKLSEAAVQIPLDRSQAWQPGLFGGLDDKPGGETIDTRAAAIEGLNEIRGRHGSVLADGFIKDFVDRGETSLVGKKIVDAHDLAIMAQVFRDPRYETLRYIFTKGDEIVGQTSVTSRMPMSAYIDEDMQDFTFTEVREMMTALDADGYYMQHNHPSGNPTPSRNDFGASKELNRQVPGFRGHIIVDHDAYTIILPEHLVRQNFTMQEIPGLSDQTYNLKDPNQQIAPDPVIGRSISQPADIAKIGKDYQRERGHITLLGLDRQNVVRMVMDITPAELGTETRAYASLRKLAVDRGLGGYAAIADGTWAADQYGDVIKRAMEGNMLLDFITIPERASYANYISSKSEMQRNGELAPWMHDTELGMTEQQIRRRMQIKESPPTYAPGGYDQTAGHMDMSKLLLDGWADQVRPALDAMRDASRNPEQNYDFGSLDPETQRQLFDYHNDVRNSRATTQRAAVRWGEANRDFGLLNYQRQYGFDSLFSAFAPYELYGTRSLFNWFTRVLDRPAWVSNFVRFQNLHNTYESQLPERMRNKMFVPMPFLPKWAGGGVFIDPTYQLFPWTQFTQPLQAYQRDQNQLANSAVYILREWGDDGTMTRQAAQDAIDARSGKDFERALAEARLRQGENLNTGGDYFSMLFSPALYMTLPYYLATGEKMTPMSFPATQLPITRFGQGVEAAFDGTPLEWIGKTAGLLAKPESFIREKLGVNEFGEWGEYYTERQVVNMVAEGVIDEKTAGRVLVEKSGPIWIEAEKRVKQELMLKVPGMASLFGMANGASLDQIVGSMLPSLFPGGLLPPGEMEYKGLKQEYGLAWEAYKNGNKDAFQLFFDEHPEYAPRLALRRDPQRRLEEFLRSEIWDGYTALDATDKKQAVAFLGPDFQDFLDADSNVEFSSEQLAIWARMLGGMVPQTPETQPVLDMPVQEIDYFAPEVTEITDQFFEERKEKFPAYYALRTAYFNASDADRADMAMRFPELAEYEAWRKKWYRDFPEYIPVFNGEVFRRVDTRNWSPMILNSVQVSALTGDRLPEGTEAVLRLVWENEGRPYDNFENWIYNSVYPSMLNEMSEGMLQ